MCCCCCHPCCCHHHCCRCIVYHFLLFFPPCSCVIFAFFFFSFSITSFFFFYTMSFMISSLPFVFFVLSGVKMSSLSSSSSHSQYHFFLVFLPSLVLLSFFKSSPCPPLCSSSPEAFSLNFLHLTGEKMLSSGSLPNLVSIDQDCFAAARIPVVLPSFFRTVTVFVKLHNLCQSAFKVFPVLDIMPWEKSHPALVNVICDPESGKGRFF
jgi:hypothetical protein